MMTNYQVHDLLRLTPSGIAELSGKACFASLPLRRFPFIVVRRAESTRDVIPIGVRGMQRYERCAGVITQNHVAASVTPESIDLGSAKRDLPAFRALLGMGDKLSGSHLTWGPTGSAGFELVSGAPVVHTGSDLDIMVRASEPLTEQTLRMLLTLKQGLPCPVDALIETPFGAFSPTEYLRSPTQCLLRTVHGPRLVASPWSSLQRMEQDFV